MRRGRRLRSAGGARGPLCDVDAAGRAASGALDAGSESAGALELLAAVELVDMRASLLASKMISIFCQAQLRDDGGVWSEDRTTRTGAVQTDILVSLSAGGPQGLPAWRTTDPVTRSPLP